MADDPRAAPAGPLALCRKIASISPDARCRTGLSSRRSRVFRQMSPLRSITLGGDSATGLEATQAGDRPRPSARLVARRSRVHVFLAARIVVGIVVLETQRTDRVDLRDVFTRFRPVKVPGV